MIVLLHFYFGNLLPFYLPQMQQAETPLIGIVIQESSMTASIYGKGEFEGNWKPVDSLKIRYFVDKMDEPEKILKDWPYGEFFIDKITVGEKLIDGEYYRAIQIQRQFGKNKFVWLNLVFSDKKRVGKTNAEIRFQYKDWEKISHLKVGYLVRVKK